MQQDILSTNGENKKKFKRKKLELKYYVGETLHVKPCTLEYFPEDLKSKWGVSKNDINKALKALIPDSIISRELIFKMYNKNFNILEEVYAPTHTIIEINKTIENIERYLIENSEVMLLENIKKYRAPRVPENLIRFLGINFSVMRNTIIDVLTEKEYQIVKKLYDKDYNLRENPTITKIELCMFFEILKCLEDYYKEYLKTHVVKRSQRNLWDYFYQYPKEFLEIALPECIAKRHKGGKEKFEELYSNFILKDDVLSSDKRLIAIRLYINQYLSKQLEQKYKLWLEKKKKEETEMEREETLKEITIPMPTSYKTSAERDSKIIDKVFDYANKNGIDASGIVFEEDEDAKVIVLKEIPEEEAKETAVINESPLVEKPNETTHLNNNLTMDEMVVFWIWIRSLDNPNVRILDLLNAIGYSLEEGQVILKSLKEKLINSFGENFKINNDIIQKLTMRNDDKL